MDIWELRFMLVRTLRWPVDDEPLSVVLCFGGQRNSILECDE